MRDRLTKKRIKVDYEHIINVLGLSSEFTQYLWSKRPIKVSLRRYALAFLRTKKVFIESMYYYLRDHPEIKNNLDYVMAGNDPKFMIGD